MKKFFSAIVLAVAILLSQAMKISSVEAADAWIYTDKNNVQYYLRDCSLPARSWSFAHVVKVNGKNVTHLAYRFEMLSDVHYSVCEGSESYVFVSRDAPPIIEEGVISNSPVAYKIWNNYLSQMEKERWARIKANESGRRR